MDGAGRRRIPLLFVAVGLALGALAGGSPAVRAQPDAIAHDERPEGGPPSERPRLDPAARSPRLILVSGGFQSIQVNVDELGRNILGDAANEPSIAASPLDPDNLVVGFRHFASVSSSFREGGYAYSFDGGRSWTFPGALEPGVFRTDPVLDVDSDGRFVYQSLHLYFSPSSKIGREFRNHMFYSTDGGVTWSRPVRAWGGDKNWMAVDRSGGPGDGAIYAIWRRFSFAEQEADIFTRSPNGGRNFRIPVVPPLVPGLGTVAVGPDSEVYLAGIDMTTRTDFDTIAVVRSDDAYQDRPPSFTAATADLGGSVGNHMPASPNPAGLLGQVEVAVNMSPGPHRGEVYLLASVTPRGAADPLDVHFARSTDGGATWEPPVRVNDDPAGRWQWFATMSVAPGGRIDAVWYDTRHSPSLRISRLYHAYSMDGGVSWSRNVPASPAFDSLIGFPGGNRKLGDYIDVVSGDDGAHVAYAATFNLEQDVYHVKLIPDCNLNGVHDSQDLMDGASADCDSNGIPDECDADSPCQGT